ncbi:MAG: hypothetical protein BWZ08_00339 [candidate division BRC1 bacterium ADurb.BinA292]|nr:MAG: hypothetical protein BWZ08_00339 [candidate division BRC1 bacterium ADurb.BinA292]
MVSPHDHDDQGPPQGDERKPQFAPLPFMKKPAAPGPGSAPRRDEDDAPAPESTRRLDAEDLERADEPSLEDADEAGDERQATMRLDDDDLAAAEADLTEPEADSAAPQATARFEPDQIAEPLDELTGQATRRLEEPPESFDAQATRRLDLDDSALPPAGVQAEPELEPPASPAEERTPPGGFEGIELDLEPAPRPGAEPTVRLHQEGEGLTDPGMQRTQRIDGVEEFQFDELPADDPTAARERTVVEPLAHAEDDDRHVTLEDTSPEALARTRADVQRVGQLREELPRPAPPAGQPRPAPPADMEPIRPEEEEVPKPFNLQPEDPELIEMATHATQDSRGAAPVRHKWLWPLIGIVIGLALVGWGYMISWSIPFEPPAPQHEMLEVERFGQFVPPEKWVLEKDLFIGRDATLFQQPWTYDPTAASPMKRGTQRAPFDPAAGLFTLAGAPPLETLTQLAWIRDSRGEEAAADAATTAAAQMPTGYLLEWREYDFLTAEQTRNGIQGTIVAAPPPILLPDTGYAFPPVAVDGAVAEGTLLVVVDQQGALTAWPMARGETSEPRWRAQLEGEPLAEPWLMLQGDGDEVNYWLVAATTAGLQSIAAASGEPAGRLAWSAPLAADRRVAMQPARAGADRWGGFVSDGRQLLLFALNDAGAPQAVWQATHDDDLGQPGAPPHLLSFVDGSRPDHDVLGVVAADGRIALYPAASREGQTPPRAIAGPGPAVTAMDVNNDAHWDLIGLTREAGQFWVAPGPEFEPLAADETPPIDEATAPGSDVLWRLHETQLIAEYFDGAGGPHRIALPLPAMKKDVLELFQRDWKRRHERF